MKHRVLKYINHHTACILSLETKNLTNFTFEDCVQLEGSLENAAVAKFFGSFKHLIYFSLTKTFDVAKNLQQNNERKNESFCAG